MTDSESIRTLEVSKCLLCEEEGVAYHRNLPDRLFGAPGLWSFLKCPNCGLVWLSPRPISVDLGKTYCNYYTHGETGRKSRMEIFQEKIALPVLAARFGYDDRIDGGWKARLIGKILSKIPLFNEIARRYVMNLHGDKRGKLLDVGCGDGRFLAQMQKLGWGVVGVEPDTKAAKIAQERLGVPVFVGILEEAKFAPASLDVITMAHVIEHVDNPEVLIRECYRILKPGGKLSIATPNIESLWHRMFGHAWRELDPPRHLYLFSFNTLEKLFGRAVPHGFSVQDFRSVAVNAGQIGVVSWSIKREEKWSGERLPACQTAVALFFLFLENVAKLFSSKAGEEILVTVRKSSV